MIPIHRLLARIRWNPAFGRGRFELAYVDHRKKSLVRLPLERVWTSPEDHFACVALEPDGSIHDVPFHRVRKVWRDGKLIWSRDGSAQAVRR